MADADDLRLRVENEHPVRRNGAYVLYWMTEARRTRWNRALHRAVTLATSLGRPLLVLEAFRSDTRYACARFHRFVLDGMADQAARFAAAGVAYYPYVEPVPGAGKGLLAALAASACAVVTDASPASLHPRMRAAAAKLLDVRLEAVDGSGLLPRAAIRDALDDPLAFRARFRRVLPPVAFAAVVEDPLAAPPPRVLERLPVEVADRWHPVRKALLDGDPELLARFRVDAAVGPVALRGGETAAREAFAAAVRAPAAAFAPDLDAWIRFGHLSTEELARTLLLRDGRIASVDLVKDAVTDHGWWTPTAPVDRFLDHVVLRREHALHRAERRGRDGDRYPALAADVRARLERAALVPGRMLADVAALEAGTGPDPAWNALQHALRTEGRLPVGARWRWTRGLLEATADPRDAFDLAVHLTHKFALDGRDPAAVAAIAEVFVDAVAPRGGKPPPSGRGKGGPSTVPPGKGGRPAKGREARRASQDRPNGGRPPQDRPKGDRPPQERPRGGADRRPGGPDRPPRGRGPQVPTSLPPTPAAKPNPPPPPPPAPPTPSAPPNPPPTAPPNAPPSPRA